MEVKMKLFILLSFVTLLSACDIFPGAAYRAQYIPELVNNSKESMSVYLIFQEIRDDGFLAVYHKKLTPGGSIPVWLNNYDGFGYVLGSYEFRIKEVFVAKESECLDEIQKYRAKGDQNNSYFKTKEKLDMFLASCPTLFKFSEKDIYDIWKGLPRQGRSCILLNSDKTVKAITVDAVRACGNDQRRPVDPKGSQTSSTKVR